MGLPRVGVQAAGMPQLPGEPLERLWRRWCPARFVAVDDKLQMLGCGGRIALRPLRQETVLELHHV